MANRRIKIYLIVIKKNPNKHFNEKIIIFFYNNKKKGLADVVIVSTHLNLNLTWCGTHLGNNGAYHYSNPQLPDTGVGHVWVIMELIITRIHNSRTLVWGTFG